MRWLFDWRSWDAIPNTPLEPIGPLSAEFKHKVIGDLSGHNPPIATHHSLLNGGKTSPEWLVVLALASEPASTRYAPFVAEGHPIQ